jgi:hypothetical protein
MTADVIPGYAVRTKPFPIFLSYYTMARKSKAKLDKPPAGPKPAFVMADPNDDAAAFGWTLGKLRYLSEEIIDGERWPGPGVFDVTYPYEVRQTYGHIIEFLNPAFLQVQLDGNQDVRRAAEKAREEGYTPEAIAKFRKVIIRVFNEQVIPDIVKRFQKAAGMVAEFYCARLAHIDTFGVEE